MINTQTQIDSLIDLAVIQRTELKQLIESLPQLRDHLSSEIERNLEEIEPAIRSELEQFVAARALDTQAKTSAELTAKLDAMARNLESTTAAKYSVLMAERAENANLLAKAEARIEDAASMLSHAVKEIVTDELSRFPRAGEIDQLRKEFAEPRGLNPRGRWQVGETYNKLDLVSYNGDSYVSSTDGNREKPSRSSEAWTLSAARGNGGGGGGATSLTDLVPVPANGELLIGNGSAFVNNTLTAGTGVTITNGPGTITIDASGAQELLTASVVNAESVPITRGQVVYLFSATGFRPSVKLANNSADATSAKTFGVVSDDSIAANGIGTVTCVGVVDKLALGAYNDGDTVYLSDTAGTITTTKPYAPNHLVYVGIIERANNGNGELYVKIQNGYELDEIHDVQITSAPLAGALLMRDATNSLWKANRLTGTANQVTVTNADTAVTLSLPTTIANVNSVTAQTATNLTLTGGNTGASLVLGSGSGAASFNRSITVSLTPSGNPELILSSTTGTPIVSLFGTGPTAAVDPFVAFSTAGNLRFGTATGIGGAGASEKVRVTNTGNLLIGTTTDMSGSGGLKVAGTTAASSTTTGALQVGSNVGLSGNAGGASYFGGDITGTSSSNITGGRFTSINSNSYIEQNGTDFLYATASTRPHVFSIGGTVRATIATTGLNLTGTTSASSSTVGALTIGNGTAATNVAIGGGNVNAGGTLTVGGAATFAGDATVGGDLTVTGGNVGVGGAPLAAVGLIMRGLSLTSGSIQEGINNQTMFSSSATSAIRGITSVIQTQAAAFTSTTGSSFIALTPILGAGSAITTQNGLFIQNQGATGVTNAYGIDIAAQSGASTTNIGLRNAGITSLTNTTAGSAGAGALVVSGGLATGAASYFGGNVTVAGTGIQVNAAGFGGAPNSYYAISSTQTLSGNGNQAFLNVSPTFNADAAGGQGNVLWVQGRTAASYTLAALAGLKVESPSIGAGGAVTTVYGLRIQDQTGGGTNYAIFTGAGRVAFGDLVFPQQAASAPTYVKGGIYFDTTLNKLRVGGATGWETITSV